MSQAYNPYYFDWTENDLRNAIWDANNGRYWRGPYGDVGELRAELRHRGLCDRGYHEKAECPKEEKA
ncbi:MAG: hypothetical protein LBQ51_04820 [Desulfovibrio sp.]|jgi:hypothetical protein|nr:hypothetical protein [Desulfovibrio sp.]